MSDKVQVAVVNLMEPEALEIIRSVSDRLIVTDVSELTRAERKGDRSRCAELDRALAAAAADDACFPGCPP